MDLTERLLRQAGVAFEPLEARARPRLHEHLAGLTRLLDGWSAYVVRSSGKLACGPSPPWRETERALDISEFGRKQELGILHLPPELQEEVRRLPAERAIQEEPTPTEADELSIKPTVISEGPRLAGEDVTVAVDVGIDPKVVRRGCFERRGEPRRLCDTASSGAWSLGQVSSATLVRTPLLQ